MRVHRILFALSFVFGAQAMQAQFSYNGSSIYYNNGNVGIGISDPSAYLSLGGSLSNSKFALWEADENGQRKRYGLGIQPYQFRFHVDQPAARFSFLSDEAGTTELMTILGTGTVGIGTTNPAAKLHISGGQIVASTDDALNGFVELWSDNAIMWKAGNSNTGLRFGSCTNLAAGNWTEMMRITDAGRLGIGTGYPAEKLEVVGNIKSNGFILPTGAAAGKVLTSDANGVASWQTVSSSSIPTGWNLSGSTSVASGPVTIGTGTLPASDALLAVKGIIYSQKVKVIATGWSDYVFDPGYKLRPLSEVENYIQQQHHLPEVPSAKEVEKDGLDVGDNQATLLKKIEELTLYIIEQNKRIEKLEKKLDSLQKQNK